MLFLAGLMGMMMLSSVAVIVTGPDDFGDPDEEQPDEDADQTASDVSDAGENALLAALHAQAGPGTDFLIGTDAEDELDGLDGDDDLRGDGGDDTLWGGDGADTLHGEAGADALHGGAGDDLLFGHDGDDLLNGGDGDDEAWGGLGHDSLTGGAGDDALLGREGNDTLIGGPGQDVLFGGEDDDLVSGLAEDGADDLETDHVNGGPGDDTLLAGRGDVLGGGTGTDDFVLGDWLAGDGASLTDFDPSADRMVLVYDGAPEDAPEVTLDDTLGDPGQTAVLADGQVVAWLASAQAPQTDDIVLIPRADFGPGVPVAL